MKRKRLFKVVLWVIIACVSVCGVLVARVNILELKHYLPTHSKANELRLAKYGVPGLKLQSIALKYPDGSSYVLNIKNGIHTGEPQKYPLPPNLPEEAATVSITFESFIMEDRDMDVMAFSDYPENDLKRDGLLIYISDADILVATIYVISGKTQVCYQYDYLDECWVVLANPPPISHYPAGRNGYDMESGWQDNKWEYTEGDATTP